MGWGLADWTVRDQDWESADQCVFLASYHDYRFFDSWFDIYKSTDLEKALAANLCAIALRRYDRWAMTPDDLRLANCAMIIKRAYRKASNDPSYKMCRARIMPPPEEFHALCSAM